jgi:hypothetical protein
MSETTGKSKHLLPDEGLFWEDPAAWYKKIKNYDDMQIVEELRTQRFLGLVDFHNHALDTHPDLKETILLFPVIKLKRPEKQTSLPVETAFFTELWLHEQIGLTEYTDPSLLKSDTKAWVRKYSQQQLDDNQLEHLFRQTRRVSVEEFYIHAVALYPDLADKYTPWPPRDYIAEHIPSNI